MAAECHDGARVAERIDGLIARVEEHRARGLPVHRDVFAEVLLDHLRAARVEVRARWRSEWPVRSIEIAERFLAEEDQVGQVAGPAWAADERRSE